MAGQIKLSVLDQSPVRAGYTFTDAVQETLELAQLVDRLGYTRYWVAEHHSTDGLAGSSPEVLVARIAGVTDEIKVGSGGVMLSHYSPLKVAENFGLLETMYPGRIDLGIGRAPGSDQLTAQALAYGSKTGAEYFSAKVRDLTLFLTDSLPDDHPLRGIHASPVPERPPEVWLLGSSDQSAALAAHFGLAFSFAQFISPDGGSWVTNAYREAFKPSTALTEPKCSLGVFVICAESEVEAEHHARSRDLWRLWLEQGELRPVPSLEDVESHEITAEQAVRIEANRTRHIVGTPEMVRERLTAMAEEYAVEEFVVNTIVHDPTARLRSYELLARAFDLMPRNI